MQQKKTPNRFWQFGVIPTYVCISSDVPLITYGFVPKNFPSHSA